MALRPRQELYAAPDPIGSTLAAAPAGSADSDADCRVGGCSVFRTPGDPNPAKVSRRDLVLALLARMPFDRLSSAATAIAELPLQVDYSPNSGPGGHDRGWGRLSVGLRWRLDATGPVGHDQH